MAVDKDIPKLINRLVKDEIKALVRIKDTLDDRFDYLRLDKKERLLPFPNDLFAEFCASIKDEHLSGYHELGETYQKLANYIGVHEDQLLLTAGSDLAIKSVYEACLSKGDNIILHLPSYAMFRVYANMFGVETRGVHVTKDWTIDADGMLACVDENTKMIVVENPNGFVGTTPPFEILEHFARELNDKNILFLIDEAYFYVEHDQSQSHKLIEQYPNVLVTQTFSKAHGLAGVRVGHLIGHVDLMDFIRRVRPMHEIASLSALALGWVLDHSDLLKDNQDSLKNAKTVMLDGLKNLNINARDSHTNFILAYLPNEGKTEHLTQKLKDKKILIRRPFEEPNLKGWILICIGAEQHSKRFLSVLSKLLNNG
jgi:histidinol-phosphate aminotransferase